MTAEAQATAQQRDAGIIAAVTAPAENNQHWREMSHEQLRAEGFVIGFGAEGEAAYRADPCKHPSLNQSLAKVIARECADDAWRQHPRGGNVRTETTAAMDESSLLDQFMTGDEDEEEDGEVERLIGLDTERLQGAPCTWRRAKGKAKKDGTQEYDECEYVEWEGYRVIDADSFNTACVRECRDDAKAKRLTPILRRKFDNGVSLANELRVRLELAGINLREGKRQLTMYWVEFSDDGTPVQCRGKLDQLVGLTVRDLKAVKTLNRRAVARMAFELGWLIQAAAYTSGLEKITGEYGRVQFEWPLVRKGQLPAAARRKPSAEMIAIGKAEWRYAVNTWARCLKDGLFPGYELAGIETVVAEPWMMSRIEELEVSHGE